jgi:serine/threonine protein kinase, bacterial
MDYIDGTDAARLVRDRYPAGMPLDEAVTITMAVASALDHADERGLLHRDVTPANILLTHREDSGQRRIFLADFGIARPLADPSGLTATNLTVGTVSYAAPEQLMGEDIDGRADEYALAATVFHLLTGAPPYHHSNPVAVISQHLNAPPPRLSRLRPDLSGLDDLFSTALAKNPDDRFAQCHEFERALSECAGDSVRSTPNRSPRSATSAAAAETQIAMTPAAHTRPHSQGHLLSAYECR